MCEYWAKIVVKSEPNKVLACYLTIFVDRFYELEEKQET